MRVFCFYDWLLTTELVKGDLNVHHRFGTVINLIKTLLVPHSLICGILIGKRT